MESPGRSSGDFSSNTAIILLTQTQFASTPQTPITLNGVGVDQIQASYTGDANYTASVSVTAPLNRSSSPPAVTLTASANSVTYGTNVTLTSTVTGNGPAPTGTVTFNDGGVFVGSGIVTNGTATYMQIFTGGSHPFTATYLGDSNYPSANSPNTVVLTVNPATPTITWSVPASVPYGTGFGAATSPEQGTFSYSPTVAHALNVGSHTITATFTPLDATDYAIGTDTITVTVTQATPNIFLTSSVNPVAPSTPVTFIASVLIGYGAATGTVSFYDGGTLLGTGTIGTVGFISEAAGFTTSNLSPGTHSITAVYSGDSNCLPATSAVFTETVPEPPPASTTTTLTITSSGAAASTSSVWASSSR